MDHLLRDIAPITERGWSLLDEEARQRLVPALAARKLVDVAGPHGWDHAATNLGRTERIGVVPVDGVSAQCRRVLPLTELRAPFDVRLDELENLERGATDPELDALVDAARRIALTENIATFHGWPDAGFHGIAEASSHPPIRLSGDFDAYPRHVAAAVRRLLEAGVSGPYGLALGAEQYTGVVETTEHGGYPLFEHLRNILQGPIVWAPGVRGAVVASQRGGDFVLETGEDLSIGYAGHDGDAVHLYIEETISFRVTTPEGAVWLSPA